MVALLLAAVLAPKIGVYLPYWNPNSLPELQQHTSMIGSVSAVWVGLDENGTPSLRGEAKPEDRQKVRQITSEHKIPLYAIASNAQDGQFDAERVEEILSDAEDRSDHVSSLVAIARDEKLDGIELDYESLQAEDRDDYSSLVEELAAALHKEKKLLAVAVHPKENDAGTWGGPAAQDWQRIGKAADMVRVMGYDYSWSGSDAGPIAPDDWVERVLKYALTKVPKEKIELGIAGYGYDWVSKPAKGLTWFDWRLIPDSENTDPGSGELIRGAAHFSGSDSNKRKIAIAQKLGVKGVVLWYLGSEDPALWSQP